MSITAALLAIEADHSLYEEKNFGRRADAIEFIDFHLDLLKGQANKLKGELEKIDDDLFKKIREKIRRDGYSASAFKEMIGTYLGKDVFDIRPDKPGYDNLDVFMNGLLSGKAIPEAAGERGAEMVFYQKTPARIVLKMAEQAQLRSEDVFVDLGSGLGQVVILMNLLTGATTRGIEMEQAYHHYAKACAADLNLSGVEFIHASTLDADYSEGDVYFLYTPFEGSILQNVLEILQKESRKRAIRIFTYGPCSPPVARQNWLIGDNNDVPNPYKLCEFRSRNEPYPANCQ